MVFIRFIEIMRFKIFLIKFKFNLIFGRYKLQVTINQRAERIKYFYDPSYNQWDERSETGPNDNNELKETISAPKLSKPNNGKINISLKLTFISFNEF